MKELKTAEASDWITYPPQAFKTADEVRAERLELEEHAFRYLAAKRDFPGINHEDWAPSAVKQAQLGRNFKALEMEFNRR